MLTSWGDPDFVFDTKELGKHFRQYMFRSGKYTNLVTVSKEKVVEWKRWKE
jgi:hypothetical protein